MRDETWNDWVQENPDRVAGDTAEGGAAPVSSRADRPSEQMIQKDVVGWAWSHLDEWPALEYLHSHPNEGRRNRTRGWIAMGIRAGIPDLVLPVASGAYAGLYLELKAGDNDLTVEQYTTMQWLMDAGNAVEIAWTAEQAIWALTHYLDDPDSFLPGY